MSDRLFHVLRAIYYVAWIILTSGCIVATWQDGHVTLGGGLAATAGILIGSIIVFGFVDLFIFDDD